MIYANSAQSVSRCRNPRIPTAFTLVELLVVIAIIGMLVSLTLPAINGAREAARRTQCENHLRQMGLACVSHESAYDAFPSGGWNWDQPPTYISGVPATGANQRAGWAFQILPFLEASTAWSAGPKIAIATPQSTYFCPSRRGVQTVLLDDAYDPPLQGGELEHALCDYAASNRQSEGIIRRYDPLRPARITDGLSATLMLSEKRLNIRALGEPQEDDNEGYTAGWNSDTIRRTDQPPAQDFSGDGDGDNLFGSSHPGGVNAVFGDGSVHLISYEVAPEIFTRLGDINDGESVDANEL